MNEELGLIEKDIHSITFLQYLESSYTTDNILHAELNMIFSAQLKEYVSVLSKENHIEFEWIDITKIEDINLLPNEIKKII